MNTKTFTCDICMEDKSISQHTICPNGHLAGCQKCHMSLIKNLYEQTLNVFTGDTSAQKCMFCREHLKDVLMGENWALKLHKLQAVMMYKWVKKIEKDITFDEIRFRLGRGDEKPKPFSYKNVELLTEKVDSIRLICKIIPYVFKDVKIIEEEEEDEDEDEEIEVEEVEVKGKKYLYDENRKNYYDIETHEQVYISL